MVQPAWEHSRREKGHSLRCACCSQSFPCHSHVSNCGLGGARLRPSGAVAEELRQRTLRREIMFCTTSSFVSRVCEIWQRLYGVACPLSARNVAQRTRMKNGRFYPTGHVVAVCIHLEMQSKQNACPW